MVNLSLSGSQPPLGGIRLKPADDKFKFEHVAGDDAQSYASRVRLFRRSTDFSDEALITEACEDFGVDAGTPFEATNDGALQLVAPGHVEHTCNA